MKNFEESLRQLNAPDPQVVAFRRKLRSDLSVAGGAQSLRRWRRACLASGSLAVVLAIALAGFAAKPAPESPQAGVAAWLGAGEISVQNDREFLEDYHARQASGVRVRSVDDERLVAIREFTMSDGRQMVVYTEVGEGQSLRSAIPLNDRLAMLASKPNTMF